VNETRLGRLFTNLFTNACHAMAETSGRLSVLIEQFDQLDLEHSQCGHPDFPVGESSTTVSGHKLFNAPCVRVTVLDTGTGIEREVMARIFEMYFSTRGAGTHRGVGMSSVADITSSYGGGIKLTSRPGVGTAVEVVFPIVSRPTVGQPSAKAQPCAISREARDVLLIDDDEDVGEMIQQMLQREGVSTDYQVSAPTALDRLLADPKQWKLVISDQIMPDLKGSDIYLRLREAGITIPFIICSAQIDPGSAQIVDALKDDFLSKPVDQDELLDKVRKYL